MDTPKTPKTVNTHSHLFFEEFECELISEVIKNDDLENGPEHTTCWRCIKR